MLIKDFYIVGSKETLEDGSYLFSVSLNPNHEVYKGHFPEKPITPGVCNIQMIKELCEDVMQKPLTLSKIDRCRLTAMVTPDGSPDLNVKIKTEDGGKINASIFYNEVTYMTLSGTVIEKCTTSLS